VERVGGKKPVVLDIRVVATSNRDIADAVAQGLFREDLFYRLNVFPLLIPALRQRVQDIVPLARHFLAAHGARAGRPGLRLSLLPRRLCSAMRGQATSASWRTSSSVRSFLPQVTSSRSMPCISRSSLAAAPTAGQRPSPPTDGKRHHRASPGETDRRAEGCRARTHTGDAGGCRWFAKTGRAASGDVRENLRYKLRQYRLAGFLEG
jgi:two-component system response regulator FlrC